MTIYHVHISPWLHHSFAFATRKQQERTSQSDAFRAAEKGMLFTSDVTSRCQCQWIVDMDDGGLQMVADGCRMLQMLWNLILCAGSFFFSVFDFSVSVLEGRPGRPGHWMLQGPRLSRRHRCDPSGSPRQPPRVCAPCGSHRACCGGRRAPCSLHRRWNMLLSGANDDEMILNRMLPISWQVQHLNHTSSCKYGRIQEELSLQ